jgi:hypothetical protein
VGSIRARRKKFRRRTSSARSPNGSMIRCHLRCYWVKSLKGKRKRNSYSGRGRKYKILSDGFGIFSNDFKYLVMVLKYLVMVWY